jgi:hypothetical protein
MYGMKEAVKIMLAAIAVAFFASLIMALAAQGRGTVTLAWDASTGTNVIAEYKVYYGIASATYTNAVSAGTNLTVSVSNLVVGATYYFAATAVDTSGLESDYSTEVSTAIVTNVVRLAAPSALRKAQ